MTQRSGRRRFLEAAVVGSAAGIAGCSVPTSADTATAGAPDAIAQAPETVALETVIGGLDAPLSVAFAPETDRRYVAERDGRVLVHESDGLRDELFLDLSGTVDTEGEKGLLGIALHPDFADNRRVFLRYSAPRQSGVSTEYSHTFVLAEFEATDDGSRARPETERRLLTIPEPRELHNAGDLAFGPEGYLYVPVGDSGHPENGQDVTENLLGSVLRLDVDDRSPHRGYGVPDDNPLVGREGFNEQYAWGFRNPWRLSFDGEDCFVADVGQSDYEEIDLLEPGGNYGWDVKEGTHCFREEDCRDGTPEDVRGGEPFLDPIVEYPHEGADVSGAAVIGGHVYRGSAVDALEGVYVFGDFLADGRLFAAAPPGHGDQGGGEGDEDDGGNSDDGLWPTRVLEVEDGRENLGRLLAMARDPDGEVYVLSTGADNGLHRVVPAE